MFMVRGGYMSVMASPRMANRLFVQMPICNNIKWIISITTHLISFERADWPKLHDVFKVRDVQASQRNFSTWFPIKVCTLNLLFINVFRDAIVHIERRCVIKAKHVCRSVDWFDFVLENCTRTESLVQCFPRKIERVNRETRHVLLHDMACQTIRFSFVHDKSW